MNTTRFVRGDIVMTELDGKGCVQQGIRPTVIISNNKACEVSPVLIVVPLTSKKKKPMPTHVELKPTALNGLSCISTFLGEQVITIDRSAIRRVLGRVNMSDLNLIDNAIKRSLAI